MPGPIASREGQVGLFFAIALLGGSLLAHGCARPGRPPGGPQDRIPPMVVSTWPDTFQVVEPTRDPIRIEFSERISERSAVGRLDGAILVSPETSEYEVKHTRSGLEVELQGGLQAGLVYRVRVLNSVRDLFGNTMESPFELVFSTGGEYEHHVLAGVVTDRITGEKVGEARVEARPRPDTVAGPEQPAAQEVPVYVAQTDTAGIYLLRYIPSGRYELAIYQDVNRNREPDFRERQGTAQAHIGLLLPRQDTIISEVELLQPDTTPAQLIRVEAEDSTTLRIEFDDFLNTRSSMGPIQVNLFREEGESPVVDQLLWPLEMDSLRAFQDSARAADSLQLLSDSLRVVADSLQGVLAALQLAGDTVDLPGIEMEVETLEARLAPPELDPEEEPEEPEAPTPILPEPVFFAILRQGLEGNQPYTVTISNVRNVNGLTGGGGETVLTWEPPDPPAEDTTGVLPDTLSARPDTAVSPPDTSALRSLLRSQGGAREAPRSRQVPGPFRRELPIP